MQPHGAAHARRGWGCALLARSLSRGAPARVHGVTRLAPGPSPCTATCPVPGLLRLLPTATPVTVPAPWPPPIELCRPRPEAQRPRPLPSPPARGCQKACHAQTVRVAHPTDCSRGPWPFGAGEGKGQRRQRDSIRRRVWKTSPLPKQTTAATRHPRPRPHTRPSPRTAQLPPLSWEDKPAPHRREAEAGLGLQRQRPAVSQPTGRMPGLTAQLSQAQDPQAPGARPCLAHRPPALRHSQGPTPHMPQGRQLPGCVPQLWVDTSDFRTCHLSIPTSATTREPPPRPRCPPRLLKDRASWKC